MESCGFYFTVCIICKKEEKKHTLCLNLTVSQLLDFIDFINTFWHFVSFLQKVFTTYASIDI